MDIRPFESKRLPSDQVDSSPIAVPQDLGENDRNHRARRFDLISVDELTEFEGAVQHFAAGRLDEAVSGFKQSISKRPHFAQAHNNLGIALSMQGCSLGAIVHFQAATNLQSDASAPHRNLGLALSALGLYEEAVASCRKAVEVEPSDPEAHYVLGNLLRKARHLNEAVTYYRASVEIKPDFQQAHYNLGLTLSDQGFLDEAIISYRRALQIDDCCPKIYNNLGLALAQQGSWDEAVACYRSAIYLRPSYSQAYCNLGLTLADQGLHSEAISCYEKAILLRPNEAQAHLNLALSLLAQGNMTAGWREYEWRWRTAEGKRRRRQFLKPEWRGEAGEGRTLLIHAEQGFGDTLQFCRYAEIAVSLGFRVVMQVPGTLVQLISSLAYVDAVAERYDDLPTFDFHCPMLSMPGVCRTTLSTIPATRQYLYADELKARTWKTRLADTTTPGPRVGVVWAGNPGSGIGALASVYRRRSIAPELLNPLSRLPGLNLFSLQKGGPSLPEEIVMHDFMSEMKDFSDTAALVANLDLVISVDTAVAHLAGALGKPVWLLNRFDSCWRWLTKTRDSSWYPALRIYRQIEPGDWNPVLIDVVHDLADLVGSHA